MTLDWRVGFSADDSTYYALPNVQDISISRGRRREIDPFRVESCTIQSRNPDGWTNIPQLGDFIIVYLYGRYISADPTYLYNTMFQGYIRDIKIDYGKVPEADIVTIECEGLQAALGRGQLVNFTSPYDDIGLLYGDVTSELNLPGGWIAAATYSLVSPVSNVNANALDFVNQLILTEQGILRSTPGSVSFLEMGNLQFVGRNQQSTGAADPPYFDDGTGSPPYSNFAFEYEQIEFRSSAEDYYNEVVVQPAGLAIQTASNAGSDPVISYAFNSLDKTTGQALQLANYVLQKFQDKDAVIKSISFYLDTQVNIADAVRYLWSSWNQITTVAFRGAIYNVLPQGFTISATPDRLTRVTVYTAGGDTNAYLRLDDAFYGRLDFNRLSF